MKQADRKKQLIAEGRLYRAQVMISKETVQANLQPEILVKNALTRMAVIAIALFRKRSGLAASGVNVPTLLPLAIQGVSVLVRKKNLLKTLLISGTVAGAAALLVKMKQAAASQEQEDDPSG